MTDDTDDLQKLARDLPAVDLDPAAAERIARRTRRDVGHGPPRSRLILPILVGMLVAITIVWVIWKVLEALR